MIRITSKIEGFRRCGVSHPTGPVDYADDRFDADQVEQLRGEPNLKVELIEGEPAAGAVSEFTDDEGLIAALENQVAELQATIGGLQEKCVTLSADLQAAGSTITELRDLVRERDASIDRLTQELAAASAGGSTDTSSQQAGSVGDAAGASAPAAEPDASGQTSTPAGQKAAGAHKGGGKSKGGGQAQS